MPKRTPNRGTVPPQLAPALAVLLLVLANGQMLVIGLQPPCG
jgi:hypothetical protein